MAIPNIVPRNNNDGETLGTAQKHWSNVFAEDVTVGNKSLASVINSVDALSTSVGSLSTSVTELSDGKLNLTGGTLTGSLILKSADGESITQQGWRTVSFYDKNNLVVSEIKGGIGASGNNYISLNSADGSGNLNECLGVRFNKSTSAHETFATTPATSDNSTKIATTQWVKNQFVLGNAVACSLNSSKATAGSINYRYIGDSFVLVSFNNLTITGCASNNGANNKLITGTLPAPKADIVFSVPSLSASQATARMEVYSTGVLGGHYTNDSNNINGMVIYPIR